jgi:HK97 family phage major capsid protein
MKYIDLLRKQLAALEERHAAILADLDALASDVESRGSTTTPEETEAAKALEADAKSVDAEADALRARIADMEATAVARSNAPRQIVPGATPGTGQDVYDVDVRWLRNTDEGRTEIAERAQRALDGMRLNADQKELVERRLADPQINGKGQLAERMLVTGSPVYVRALKKVIFNAHPYLDNEEARALTAATDASGGYAMPFTLDPTLIDINAGVANPIRQLARIRTTMTDNWQGVTSAGMTASWDAEASEVSDDTPTLAQPAISIKHPRLFVPFSLEHEDDIDVVLSTFAEEAGKAKDRLESAAFATGATGGNNAPGIVTLLVAASKTVASATTDTFAVADLYSTQAALPDRYDDTASWLMNKAVINLARQFGTANNHALLTNGLQPGDPAQLLGAPLYRWSSLDGSITGSADNYIAIYGDIAECYTIVDRLGMSIELIPHLFATANNLPSGQRGLYARWRVGAGLTNADAARVLNVT